MFISLYSAEVFSPRIQEYFRAACLTLMDESNMGTLVDVPKLFTNKVFLNSCREKLKDSDAQEFWATYDQMASREKDEMIPYFSSKFAPLVRSYVIRNFIGQKKSLIDLEESLNEKKTILVRLSKGKLGDLGMRLIGMIFMSRLKSLIFARSELDPKDRVPVSLYVDEFQNFVSEGFQTLLSESRKYGLGLILAHQYLSQMKQAQFQLYGSGSGPPLLDAIFGNVGNLSIFRIGAGDAQEILPYLGGNISESDLVNLDNFKFLGRLLNSGVLSSPMTVSAHREEYLNYVVPKEEYEERLNYLMERFKL